MAQFGNAQSGFFNGGSSGGGGGVSSVGATTPLTSSGGATPNISTNIATNKLVGRYSASSGVMEEVTIGDGLNLTAGGQLNNTATPTPLGYYGSFYDTTTQNALLKDTAYAVKFNTTDIANGISIVNNGLGNPTRVTIANSGVYDIEFSLQLEKTGGSGNFTTDIWLRKNGVNVPYTTGKVVLTGSVNASPIVPAWNFVVDAVAGDYYELMWAVSNENVIILSAVATPPYPAIPSSILTVTQQSGIMAGTGITAINSLTSSAQTMATGTSGTDFAISSASSTHTFNLPTASATNRGALSTTDWNTFNNKPSNNSVVSGYQGLGSPVKAVPIGMNLLLNIGTATSFLSGRQILTPVYLSNTSTITGVKWFQARLGNYTANNYNGVALYSVSGSTLTLVASSTNDGTIWQTFATGTWGNKAFSSPVTNLVAGTYYVSCLYNASVEVTVPQLQTFLSSPAIVQVFDFTGSRLNCFLGAQNTLPSPLALSGTTNSTTMHWLSLY